MSFHRTLSNCPCRNRSNFVSKPTDITQHHMTDIRRAIAESNTTKLETGATISRYVIRMSVDPLELLQTCASLGNKLLCDLESIEADAHLVCCQILQQFMSLEDDSLLSEQVRLCLRLKYLPSSFRECHLPLIASAVSFSREDIAQDRNSYSGFVTLSGRVTSVSLTEYIINYLHFTPTAPRHRVIKRAEDNGFMETGTDHCDLEMPESVLDRVYLKQQKLTMECLSVHRAEGCFVNQMELLLQDDLANNVSLGEHIQVIGRMYRSFPEKNQETYLHGIQMDVNNVLRVSHPTHGSESLPGVIEAIIASKMSPWNTSQAIVDLLVPSEAKNSLTGKDATAIRRSIHVLVIKNGHDTIVPTLMERMAALKCCIFWDHGEETARKSLYTLHQSKRSSTGEISASEMSAVRDGVVLFELDQLDKKAQAHITPLLTTVNGGDIGIQRDNLSQYLDVTCCCWVTYTSVVTSSKKSLSGESGSEEFVAGPAHGIALNEKFDVVVAQHELDAASDVSLSVASYTLRRHMKDDLTNGLSQQLTREDFSQYLRIASAIKVRLSGECEQLLRAYFQVMRKKAFGSDVNTLSSLSTMSTLLNLATCHARVCLRSVANRYDALVSIMMMEETVAARFGTSCLGFVPLLDGKENVTRLYAHSGPSEAFPDQDAPHVPNNESNFEEDADMMGPIVAANTDVPMSLQDTRDQVMDTMYAHLTRVISEYADWVDL
ncbi:Minichromosome maintenance domain-containing protein 2 [Mortierella sp. NVP41]|nr:Minichromosome maintenance domain-containing protein 2 [Mortierella sp. NVP41]